MRDEGCGQPGPAYSFTRSLQQVVLANSTCPAISGSQGRKQSVDAVFDSEQEAVDKGKVPVQT